EMNNGGREALLHHLLTYDLSTVNLRETPKTAALVEQKVASFTPEEDWWHDVLQRGELPRIEVDQQGNCKCLKKILHLSYIGRTSEINARNRRSTETKLGMFVSKAVGPSLKHERVKAEPDKRYYIFPPLKDCRAYWAALMQTTIIWDDPEAKWQK